MNLGSKKDEEFHVLFPELESEQVIEGSLSFSLSLSPLLSFSRLSRFFFLSFLSFLFFSFLFFSFLFFSFLFFSFLFFSFISFISFLSFLIIFPQIFPVPARQNWTRYRGTAECISPRIASAFTPSSSALIRQLSF